MKDRLLQEIDVDTGEVVASTVLAYDEHFYIQRGVDKVYPSGYYYDKWCIKSFSLKRYWKFFNKHRELYFVLRVLSEWLCPDSGILRRVNEPYKWRHLSDDLGVDRTTVYRWREKLINYGLVGELVLWGKKHIAINPFIFGLGIRVIKQVADYFEKRGKRVRANKRTINDIR